MMTEKDHAFVRFLTEGTETGTVKWEPTALQGQFTASFKGKYNAAVRQYREFSGDVFSILELSDGENGRELLRLEECGGPLATLYSSAQRAALNVDAAIDEIMGE